MSLRRAPFIRPPASRPPRATLALPSLPRTAQPARDGAVIGQKAREKKPGLLHGALQDLA